MSTTSIPVVDSLIRLYRIKMCLQKWYLLLFLHLIDMTVTNAWLLHRQILSSAWCHCMTSRPMWHYTVCFNSSGDQAWSAIGKHWSVSENEEKTKQADTLSRALLWWFSPISKTWMTADSRASKKHVRANSSNMYQFPRSSLLSQETWRLETLAQQVTVETNWPSDGFYCAMQLCQHSIGSRNSVCLSVTRVLCDKTKHILIPHEKAIPYFSDKNSSW